MKKEFINGILLLLMGVLFIGCHKDNNGNSDEQMQEVLENAQEVMSIVSVYFENADSVSDMACHLDEIKAMDYVEDAWQEDNSIAVKIKDGGILKWCFFPHNTLEKGTLTVLDGLKDIKTSNRDLCEEKTACISVTVPYDEWRMDNSDIELLNSIGSELETNEYDVIMVLGEDVTPSFLYKQMPKYGVNILITHGGCDKKGKHWIMTGLELKNATMIENILDWQIQSEWFSNRMQLWNQMEIRDGEWGEHWYLALSEDCINEKMYQHFPKNSFMFAWACSTLKGSNFYDVLKNKGLGCYFGYDDEVEAKRAGRDLKAIMQSMLGLGYTAHEAYSKAGEGANPKLKLYPANSNITLVGCNCIDTSDWIDLGLPSGLLWATRNVGASSLTDYGNYYAWGETTPKSVYNWSTYRYSMGGINWITKYCTDSFYGNYPFTDGLTTLQPDDDAATANYGGRTPTKAEWEELINNTTSQWVTINGVNGRCFTGRNGNSLFLPAAGVRYRSELLNAGSACHYWSSSLCTDIPDNAWGCNFYPCNVRVGWTYGRDYGLSVRAVRSAK